MKVDDAKLRTLLGITTVHRMANHGMIAIVDKPLVTAADTGSNDVRQEHEQKQNLQHVVTISNFKFTPETLSLSVDETVRWTNKDDAPHRVVASDGSFKSPLLDTDDHFDFTPKSAGKLPYFCSLHPHMTGEINVS